MLTDSVADLLTRVRNAQRAGHSSVRVPYSKLSNEVLRVLSEEGFIGNFEKKETEKYPEINIFLKYYPNGDPAIGAIQRVSKPGRRVYASKSNLDNVYNGLGIAIVSTSQGVMSDRNARSQGIGGEVLASVS